MIDARLRRWLQPVFGALLFAVALWVLRRELEAVHYRDLHSALDALPSGHALLALLLTVANYLVLTGYDRLAFVYIGKRLAPWRISLASSTGYAISNSVGFALLSGTSVRYRFYSRWGVEADDLSRVVLFNFATFWLGLLALGGCSLVFLRMEGSLAQAAAPLIGGALMAAVAAYLSLSILRKSPLRLRGFELRVPSPHLALSQLVLSVADWALAAAVLHALLPAGAPPYAVVLGAFLAAQILGLASTIPGGLGVFEGTMVVLLGPYLPGAQVLTALVLYRVIYYVLPLALALFVILVDEIQVRRGRLAAIGKSLGASSVQLAPKVLSIFTFLAGLLLLAFGATPAQHDRLHWIARILPIGLIEVSHLLGSILGAGLLILAQAIARRLRAAYYLAIAALLGAIVTSVLKGADWAHAVPLLLLLLAFAPGRSLFDRDASLFDTRFSPAWILAIAAGAGASVWLGFFIFRHVEYSNDLWWQVALDHDAPRFLRASVGVAVILAGFAAWRLLRPLPRAATPPSDEDLADAARAIGAQEQTLPFLVYLRDKAVLFNADRSAFVMYGVQGRTWAALGDPVGPQAAASGLIRAFAERADDLAGRPVFYQVGAAHLHRYADLGMAFVKLGEEARIPLDSFSLEGGKHHDLRLVANRLARQNVTFRVVGARDVSPLLPRLKEVSDDWLARKSASEKGFSLGHFDPGYLARLPVAVMQFEGRVVAFANVLPGPGGVELSVDLMRFSEPAPRGTMDGLFAHLFLWGREQGYRWFNLGMAPLSGLEASPLSPMWTCFGRFLYRHGAAFYNFEGLRAYKNKFHPVWEPRYLAYPGGLALPLVLADIAALSAGGYARIFR